MLRPVARSVAKGLGLFSADASLWWSSSKPRRRFILSCQVLIPATVKGKEQRRSANERRAFKLC
jgi:hypothetical protein